MPKDIRVFYHGNCRDGFTAAWAAWKKFGDSADYIPMVWTHLDPKVPDIGGKDVYFLDFVPTDEEFARVKAESKSMTVIDHHISREHLTRSLSGSVFDDSHSAAVLAWQYFHPDKKVPQLCLYVEDSDIWNWKIPNSGKVLSYIDLKELDFNIWNSLAEDMEDERKREEYEEKGGLILSYRDKILDYIIRDHAQLVNFEGYEVYAVNAPRYFRSEIGNKLYEMKSPFGIVWNYTPKEISVSLRARKGEFDLLPLAAKYGGGGHKAACNFRLPLGSPLPWKIIKENGK
jgi:oligoribonuclease NrnB/cAMP/cGMP phosphodiesterase (DHH superfamily)